MSAFQYAALDTRGKTRKGVLEGDNARQVRQSLRDQGLTPLQVDEVEGRQSTGSKRTWGASLNAGQLALVTRQLATLVGSGLPVERALGAVAEQAPSQRVSSLLMAVRSRVTEGHSLATAMGDFPRVFPQLYRATVEAGEQSGHLEQVFERLADYTEARQRLTQKVMLALFYPAILTVVALLIVTFLLLNTVPQVVQVFRSSGQELPFLTRALISLSDFLSANAGMIFSILIAAIVISVWALRRPAVQGKAHALLLKLPLIGRLIRGINAARYTRTLSILLGSGVPMLDALSISAPVISNLPMQDMVNRAAIRVKEGGTLADALGDKKGFPPMTVQLIASGEASGRLESMLERAASQQEHESETLIASILGMFEPLLILAMGGVVLTIVLAILLPIFDLNQLVQ